MRDIENPPTNRSQLSESEADEEWTSASAGAASTDDETEFDSDEDDENAAPPPSSDSEIDDPVVRFLTQQPGGQKKNAEEARRASAEADYDDSEPEAAQRRCDAGSDSDGAEAEAEAEAEKEEREREAQRDPVNGLENESGALAGELNQTRVSPRSHNRSAAAGGDGSGHRSLRVPRSPHASDFESASDEGEPAAADADAEQPPASTRAPINKSRTQPNAALPESPEREASDRDVDAGDAGGDASADELSVPVRHAKNKAKVQFNTRDELRG